MASREDRRMERSPWPDRSWLAPSSRPASADEVARPHGLYAAFFEDGRLESLRRYRDGLPDGHWFIALAHQEERAEFSDNPRGYSEYAYGRVWESVDWGDDTSNDSRSQTFRDFVEEALKRLTTEDILLLLPAGRSLG